MQTLKPVTAQNQFPLSRWEWMLLAGVVVLVFASCFWAYLPRGIISGVEWFLVGSMTAGLVGYFVLVPAIALLVRAGAVAVLVLSFCVRLLIGLLTFLGAAWRGEIRP